MGPKKTLVCIRYSLVFSLFPQFENIRGPEGDLETSSFFGEILFSGGKSEERLTALPQQPGASPSATARPCLCAVAAAPANLLALCTCQETEGCCTSGGGSMCQWCPSECMLSWFTNVYNTINNSQLDG